MNTTPAARRPANPATPRMGMPTRHTNDATPEQLKSLITAIDQPNTLTLAEFQRYAILYTNAGLDLAMQNDPRIIALSREYVYRFPNQYVETHITTNDRKTVLLKLLPKHAKFPAQQMSAEEVAKTTNIRNMHTNMAGHDIPRLAESATEAYGLHLVSTTIDTPEFKTAMTEARDHMAELLQGVRDAYLAQMTPEDRQAYLDRAQPIVGPKKAEATAASGEFSIDDMIF